MSHLDYYQYQTTARGVISANDVARIASDDAPIFDGLVLPWLPSDRNVRIVAFAEEGIATITDRRWLKVPLAHAANFLLRGLIRAASREHVKYLRSTIWACLRA